MPPRKSKRGVKAKKVVEEVVEEVPVEEVQPEVQPEAQPETQPEAQPEVQPETKIEAEVQPEAENMETVETKIEPETEPEESPAENKNEIPNPLYNQLATFFKSKNGKFAFFQTKCESVKGEWKIKCVLNDRYFALDLPSMKKTKAQESLAVYIFNYLGCDDSSNVEARNLALHQKVQYWNASGALGQVIQNVVFEHVYPFESNKAYKKCRLTVDGEMVTEAEASGFSEARDMCAMKALNNDVVIQEKYFNWIMNAFQQQTYNPVVEEHHQVNDARNQTTLVTKVDDMADAVNAVVDAAKVIKTNPNKGINPQELRTVEDIKSSVDFENRVFSAVDLEARFGEMVHANPCQILNQFGQKRGSPPNFDYSSPDDKRYQVCTLSIGDETCNGLASNKKIAKQVACQGMLMLMGMFKGEVEETMVAADKNKKREKNAEKHRPEGEKNNVQEKLHMICRHGDYEKPTWSVKRDGNDKDGDWLADVLMTNASGESMTGAGLNKNKRVAKEMAAMEIVTFWEELNGKIEDIVKAKREAKKEERQDTWKNQNAGKRDSSEMEVENGGDVQNESIQSTGEPFFGDGPTDAKIAKVDETGGMTF